MFVLLTCLPGVAQAPNPPAGPLTLNDAIERAVANYPAVRAAQEQVEAAAGGVKLARTAYLPRTDVLWQDNRATRNNIFGLLLPNPVISPISGPVLPTTSGRGVWGSAAGALFSWEPFDFGLRRAVVEAAHRAQNRAGEQVGLTRLDVATAAAGAFLALVAAEERVTAAQADVERRKVFADSIRTLVKNQLRPGADASRAEADLAAARTQLIEAETAVRAARAALGRFLGIPEAQLKIERGPLLGPPPANAVPPAPPSDHPLAEVEKARIEEARARVRIVDRSYFPRFELQSAASGRGSGAKVDGGFGGGTEGLGFERGNWAAGLTVRFSLFDLASIRARRQIELSNQHAEEARYDQTLQDLNSDAERASAALDGALRVAENTPVQLRAARDTESQARARYQAGLANIVEVADAQRLLAQAEIDDAVARLNIWRALAGLSAAQGNLEPFMKLLRGQAP